MVTARSGAGGGGAGRTIGVISPLVGGFYFGGIIAGVTRAAARQGMRVVAVQTFPTRLARERHQPPSVPGEASALNSMDAVVVVTDAMAPERLRELLDSGRPVVLVGSEDPGLGVPVLHPDNAGGARAAVDHLVAHGHKRIGFVGDLEQSDIRERHAGWLAALNDHGITPEEDWFVSAPGNTVPAGADAAEAFLRAGAPTTALLAATDLAAIGMIRGLQRGGSVVPRDQAVIGFDHTQGGARLTPRLATVDPHHDRVGELAVAHALALLRGNPTPPLHVPATLIALESCGCPRAAAAGRAPGDPAEGTEAALALRRVAATAFAGPVMTRRGRTSVAPETAWADVVLTVLDSAAERGTPPSSATLRRLRDLTAAMEPYPETLEQCVAAVRDLEQEVAGLRPEGPRRAAHRKAVTDVLLALAQGCQRPAAAREAAMERQLSEQYEVDVDIAAGRGGARNLTWIPGGGRTSACLGLWTGRTTPSGSREIEVAGALARSGTLARSIGRKMPAEQFPPTPLLRAEPIDGSTLVFVVPVTSPERDWGLLAVTGRLDPRMLHSRERHQHWGALLALALDEEERLAQLQARLAELEVTNSQNEARAVAREANDERQRLWLSTLQHAVWDWDVAHGSVHWSEHCAELFGADPAHLTNSPSEWLDRVHPDDRVALSALLAAQLGGANGPLRIEHRLRRDSGEYRWVYVEAVTVADEAGVPARLLGALLDITDRKEHEIALVGGVLRDSGTGLPNRASVLDRLGTVLGRAHRGHSDAALGVLRVVATLPARRDTDGPTDGPAATAAAVQALAQRLEAEARHGDVVGHLDETTLACVLLDTADESGAGRLAAILDDLPGQLRRGLAVGVISSVLPYDDPIDAVHAAEAMAAQDVPGVVR